MRLPIYVLMVVLMLGLAACGDDEPSQSASGQTQSVPSASGPSGAGAEGSPGAEGRDEQDGGGESASEERGSRGEGDRSADRRELLRQLRRRPSRRGDFKGASRTIYYEARARCLAIPLRGLARSYGASSDQPDDVARAYAQRQAPTGEGRTAAVAGCLDGITTRVRRGL